jgi:hypothetical protein
MSILIKCNESDLSSGNEQTFTLQKQKEVGLARGLEAFVWVSERPREGRPLQSGGLRMRGQITDWIPANGGRTTVSVQITESLPDGLGMDGFADVISDAARDLHRRIHGFRHRRIWGLSASEREALHDAFEARSR